MDSTSIDRPSTGSPGWRHTLVCLWLAQFLNMAGFSFGLPFTAYYIQELGISDPEQVRFWYTWFSAAPPITFMLSAPFWGWLADRHGRRPMVIRASLAAAVILFAMGLVSGVGWLIVLRLTQGLFTGTISAANALVTTTVPDRRRGLALGLMATAMAAGVMSGNFFGGITSAHFGCAISFQLAGVLSGLATLLVVFGTREHFIRAEADPTASRGWRALVEDNRILLPIYALILLIWLAACCEIPVTPLFIQQLANTQTSGSTEEVLQASKLAMGNLGALSSLAGMAAGLTIGHLADRIRPQWVVACAAGGAALATLPLAWAGSLMVFFICKPLIAFCSGGLDPVLNAWIGRLGNHRRTGLVFGLASSIRSLAWFLAPLAGHQLARWGFATVYLAEALCLVLVVALALAIRCRPPLESTQIAAPLSPRTD